MNPDQLSQFAATFAQLSQQMATMASSIESISKQLQSALQVSDESHERKKPKLSLALQQEVDAKLAGVTSSDEYQHWYLHYAAEGNVEACLAVYHHSQVIRTKLLIELIGPAALACLFTAAGRSAVETMCTQTIIPNIGYYCFNQKWLRSCGLHSSTLDSENKYNDTNVLVSAQNARIWLPTFLSLYVFTCSPFEHTEQEKPEMFCRMVDWKFPIIKDTLNMTLCSIFSKFASFDSKDKIDLKPLVFVDWMLDQSQMFKASTEVPSFENLPSLEKLLTTNTLVKCFITGLMNDEKNVDYLRGSYTRGLVLALFFYLTKRVYNFTLMWDCERYKVTQGVTVETEATQDDVDEKMPLASEAHKVPEAPEAHEVPEAHEALDEVHEALDEDYKDHPEKFALKVALIKQLEQAILAVCKMYKFNLKFELTVYVPAQVKLFISAIDPTKRYIKQQDDQWGWVMIDINQVFNEVHLQHLEKYLTSCICVQWTQAVCDIPNIPKEAPFVLSEALMNVFRFGSGMKKFKFLSDILPIEMWQTTVSYTLNTLVHQPLKQLGLIILCLRQIYLCLISNITYKASEPTELPVRLGNPVKVEMAAWFSFIGHQCNTHKIKLDDAKFLADFWHDMIQHVRDIRWFILNCAVKWSASPYMFPLLDALKLVKVDDCSKYLSRDTMYLLKKIHKHKYTVGEYLVELLEDWSDPAVLLQHLKDLDVGCNYDFKGRQKLMYHACVGMGKKSVNGQYQGSNDVIKFLADKGLEAWEDAPIDMCKHMKVNQFWLYMAIEPVKSIKHCYQICAAHGWSQQAMWVYNLSIEIPAFDNEHVLIHHEALDIAQKNNHTQFIHNMITGQSLHCVSESVQHTQWAQNAGKMPKGRNLKDAEWWIQWMLKYIMFVEDFELFQKLSIEVPCNNFLDLVICGLIECWVKGKVDGKIISLSHLPFINWILARTGCIDRDTLRLGWDQLIPNTVAHLKKHSEQLKDLIRALYTDEDVEEQVYSNYPNVALLFKFVLDPIALLN